MVSLLSVRLMGGFLSNGQRLFVFLLMAVCSVLSLKAAPPEWWQRVHNYDGASHWASYMTYAPAFFGPNALPVPELADGTIATSRRAELSSDFFWGFGDQTQSLSAQFTYVFIPGRVAITGSGVLVEHYKTTLAVRDVRASLIESAEETLLMGDFYISTQVALLRERGWKPDVSVDVILKTASSKSPEGARFFDTPGYAFRLAAGKSFATAGGLLDSIRLAVNVGFLSYQINTPIQNDAPLYGALIRMYRAHLSLDAGVGGYNGWIRGSRPLVFRSKLSLQHGSFAYFIGYQHAFRDYPFHRLQTGLAVSF